MRKNDKLNCTAYRFILSNVLLNSFALCDEAVLGDVLGAWSETPCVLNLSPTVLGWINPYTILTLDLMTPFEVGDELLGHALLEDGLLGNGSLWEGYLSLGGKETWLLGVCPTRPVVCKPKVSMTSLCLTAAPNCLTSQSKGKYFMRASKLYTPSTLNIYLILWHT